MEEDEGRNHNFHPFLHPLSSWLIAKEEDERKEGGRIRELLEVKRDRGRPGRRERKVKGATTTSSPFCTPCPDLLQRRTREKEGRRRKRLEMKRNRGNPRRGKE